MSLQAYAQGTLFVSAAVSSPFISDLADFMEMQKTPPDVVPARPHRDYSRDFGGYARTIYHIGGTGYAEQLLLTGRHLPPRIGWRFFRGDTEARAQSLDDFASNDGTGKKHAVQASLLAALHFAHLGDCKKAETVAALERARDIVVQDLPKRAERVAVAMKRGGDWLASVGNETMSQPFYIAAAETILMHLDKSLANAEYSYDLFRKVLDALQFASASAFLGQDWNLAYGATKLVAETIDRKSQLEDDVNPEFLDAGGKEYIRAAYYQAAMFGEQEKARDLLLNAAFMFGRLSAVGEETMQRLIGQVKLDRLMTKLVEPYRPLKAGEESQGDRFTGINII